MEKQHMTLQISYEKQTQTVYLPSSTTVEELKKQISNLWSISPAHQMLLFHKKILTHDQNTLWEEIQGNQACIDLAYLQSRDFQLNNLQHKEVKRVHKSTNPRSYKRIKPGLILRAQCKTSGCEAESRLVSVNKGFGSFELGKILWSGVCPLCSQKTAKVSNFGYYKARLVITGIKSDGQELKLSVGANDGKYHTFKDTNQMAEWSFVDIAAILLD